MSAPWWVSSIIVKVTSRKDWEYRAINQLEQVFQQGNQSRQAVQMLNNQDFTIQLFASLVPHKGTELAHELHRLTTAKYTRAPLRGELLDPGTSTVKERSRQKSSWDIKYKGVCTFDPLLLQRVTLQSKISNCLDDRFTPCPRQPVVFESQPTQSVLKRPVLLKNKVVHLCGSKRIVEEKWLNMFGN